MKKPTLKQALKALDEANELYEEGELEWVNGTLLSPSEENPGEMCACFAGALAVTKVGVFEADRMLKEDNDLAEQNDDHVGSSRLYKLAEEATGLTGDDIAMINDSSSGRLHAYDVLRRRIQRILEGT